MKKTGLVLGGALSVMLVTGCATGLSKSQEREYNQMQASGVLVEEKNPSTCAWFGLLPGGGSFCAREPGLGIVNLLFWPLSIFWDPVSGYDGAQAINYDTTKYKLKKEETAEIQALDTKMMANQIDPKQYEFEKHKIESKYDFE